MSQSNSNEQQYAKIYVSKLEATILELIHVKTRLEVELEYAKAAIEQLKNAPVEKEELPEDKE
jgi:hypothetical protein